MPRRPRRRSRRALIAATVVAGTAWVALRGDAGRDLTQRLGLTDPAPFEISLGGRLWSDRTLRDDDGAPDVAYVVRDEQLDVEVRGREGRRVAAILIGVDDFPRSSIWTCATAPCSASVRTTTRPALRGLPSGPHRVSVAVVGEGGGHTTSSFEVTTARSAPPVREREPRRPDRATLLTPRPVLRARAIVVAQQRAGILRRVLGASRWRMLQSGPLEARGRPLGVTMLLVLAAPRVAVRATVPAYVPEGRGYRPTRLEFRARVLRDLLVDVDLRKLRIIAVEPGPASTTDAWPPQRAISPSGDEDED